MVAALASYLDARAHRGRWLIRIEDVDVGRAVPGAAEGMLALLDSLGMRSDGEVVWQSRRTPLYQAACERLGGAAYPCGCNRREIADSRLGVAPDGSAIYPGTCRAGLAPGREGRSIRVRVPDGDAATMMFEDRLAGRVTQHLDTESGDFVLKRADGFFAYQLAVVVDDGAQGVTDVVRGADLIDSTARQIYLQRLLDLPTPRYLHVPVIRNALGEKLSKQTGAGAIVAGDAAASLRTLCDAARFLGLPMGEPASMDGFWDRAVPAWAALAGVR